MCCTSIFAITVFDGSAMKNQPTETDLTKSKVDLLTPRPLFGPYLVELYSVSMPMQADALAHAMI